MASMKMIIQSMNRLRQDVLIKGIRISGLERGQSSPASIMRMSVEMSTP